MKYNTKYSIGEVSQICNISKKALRYYDNISLITTQRQDYNNYRYYTHEALLAVPVIKYYKQMGFTLDEMRKFIDGDTPNVYKDIQSSFLLKIEELKKEQENIQRQYISTKDWYDLILEAEAVIEHNIQEVSIKYVEAADFLCHEQEFDNNIKAFIINIDFTNYVESLNNKISGPVIINFSSFKNRMQSKDQKIKIMQKALMPYPEEAKIKFGGEMMVACYHIGGHETINKSYQKICAWAKQNNYVLGDESFERYVTDYWTTKNSTQFVTELMLKITRRGSSSQCEDV